jgi:hypothetical protein
VLVNECHSRILSWKPISVYSDVYTDVYTDVQVLLGQWLQD